MIVGLLALSLVLGFQAQNVSPESIRQHMEMAQQLLAAGKADAAAREFQAILTLDPNNVNARVDLGVLAFFHHDCGTAAPNLTAALRLQPSLYKAQALLGLCEKEEGLFPKAEADLAKALPHLRNPKVQLLAANNLIEIYYQQGDLNRAASVIAGLLRTNSTNPTLLFMDYRIHNELAEGARDALALVAPDSARMHELMAEEFVNRGNAAEAIVEYQKALAKDPGLPGVHYELGEAIMQNSTSEASLERAEHEFKVALAENPKNAGAVAKLGRIAFSRGDMGRAEEEYHGALALQPDQTEALKGMAEIYSRRGQAERAIEYLLHARQSAPFDETIYYRLASLYRKLGRTSEARREMARFENLRTIKNESSLAHQQSGP